MESDTRQTSERLLRVYGIYRLVLSALLLFIFLTGLFPIGDNQSPQQVSLLLRAWLVLSLLDLFSFAFQRVNRIAVETLGLAVDICVLAALNFLSGGVESGLVFLVLPTVASTGLCLQRRHALVVTAIGVCALLVSQGMVYRESGIEPSSSVRTALLGTLFFIVTALMLYLRHSLDRAEQLARASRERAEQLQLLNETVLQRMLTGIVAVNRAGDFVLINPAAEKLLGTDRRSTARQSLNLSHFQALQRAYKRWLQNPESSTPPYTDNRTGNVLQPVFRHIATDPDYLDVIFVEDARSIARHAQEIKIRSLEKISAGVAHEIRNPLAAVSQANELLRQSESLSGEDRRMTDIIERHCDRMNRIIETIFTMSRRLEPHRETIELKRWLVDFVADYIESHSRDVQIDISLVADDARINFDSGHLGQVLTNLFDNGIRYSERATGRGRVVLATLQAGHSTALEVRDDGPGIPVDIQRRIFDPFFTTESKGGGTGLGLYMSRELCDANFASLAYVCKNDAAPQQGFFRITFRTPEQVNH